MSAYLGPQLTLVSFFSLSQSPPNNHATHLNSHSPLQSSLHFDLGKTILEQNTTFSDSTKINTNFFDSWIFDCGQPILWLLTLLTFYLLSLQIMLKLNLLMVIMIVWIVTGELILCLLFNYKIVLLSLTYHINCYPLVNSRRNLIVLFSWPLMGIVQDAQTKKITCRGTERWDLYHLDNFDIVLRGNKSKVFVKVSFRWSRGLSWGGVLENRNK